MVALGPPEFAQSLREYHRICRQVSRVARSVILPDRQLLLHRVVVDASGKGMASGLHAHSFYEGIIVLRGTAAYTTPDKTELLGPGRVLLFAPFARHSWYMPDAGCLRLAVEFASTPTLTVPQPAQWPEWLEILQDVAILFSDVARQSPGWSSLITPRLAAILSRIVTMGELTEILPPEVPEPLQFVHTVETFLTDNLSVPLSLADVAQHLVMSERSLMRRFRQITGMTVVQRLSQLRMERASTLLAETNLSVYVIAAQVGLPDASYFCSRFRQCHRMTPAQYRTQAAASGVIVE